jgi:deoxyadenosine/deoxycytidine kinase
MSSKKVIDQRCVYSLESVDKSINNVKRKNVFVISGTPGAGKSTLSRRVAKKLKTQKCKIKLTHISCLQFVNYAILYFLAKYLYKEPDFRRLIKGGWHPISFIADDYIKKLLKNIWLLETLFCYEIFLVKVFLPLKLGYRSVIVDEGAINIIGNYMMVFGKIDKKMLQRLIANVLIIFKKISYEANVTVYFLDADNSELLNRWKLRGCPIEGKHNTYKTYFEFLENIRLAEKYFSNFLPFIQIIKINTSSNANGVLNDQ